MASPGGAAAGRAAGLINDNYLAADGIENVIRVLEDLEDEKFKDVDFIELNACSGGCVGGVLNVENPYVARTKLYRLRKLMPVSLNHLEDQDNPAAIKDTLKWDTPLEFVPVLKLDDNMLRGDAEDGTGGGDCPVARGARLRVLRRAYLPGAGGGRCPGAGVDRRLHLLL